MVIFRRLSFYLALAGIGLASSLTNQLTTPPPAPIHLIEPAMNPYESTVAASGIIEGIDKNIEIGIPQAGLIKEIYVKVCDTVEQGQPLFQIDDRELQAQLHVQRANVAVSMAILTRLKDQLKRLESIHDPRAISQEELVNRRNDVWVAEAELKAAEAQIQQTQQLIARLTICAPKNGTILQNNIRVGEFAQTSTLIPPIILGDLRHLQVRADIDEQNASQLIVGQPAVAYPKNLTSHKIALIFDRVEPYVIPKRSLTGASDERVDTRVLQVIYHFERPETLPLYVGQQVDVFIQQDHSKEIAVDEL